MILYILSFSLVRLRTFRLAHGLVRCSCARREDVSFTDVRIKPQIGNEPGGVNDVMHWKRGLRFEKKQELSFCLRRRRLTFGACRGLAVAGGRWNSQHRKIVYLSPYVEKPFNSKVIKSFVPELRSRKCFLCFGIPMLSIYELCTFYEYVHFTYSCLAM